MIVTLIFSQPLNTSISIGDTVYYQEPITALGFNYLQTTSPSILLGVVTAVDFANNSISVDSDTQVTITSTHYITFSKDNAVALSSVIGYYAAVKMVNDKNGDGTTDNNRHIPAELYQVSVDTFESSK